MPSERGGTRKSRKPTASSNRKGRYVYMTCGNRASGGTCTNRFRFRLDIAREAVMEQVSEALFSPEAVEALKKTLARLVAERLATRDEEVERLEEQKAACRRKVSAVMQLMMEAKERGDETDDLWAEELAKQKASLEALEEREKELRVGPRLDLSRLTRVVAQAVERQKEGLARVKEPEMIRDALRVLVGEIEARPDGRVPGVQHKPRQPAGD